MQQLKKDFSFIKKEVAGVLLFGSAVSDVRRARDYDICLVAPQKDSGEIMKKIFHTLNLEKKRYEVYCFEELPLYMKWEVIREHDLIYALNPGEIYEYFYYFRKLYAEQKHRMELSKEELFEQVAH